MKKTWLKAVLAVTVPLVSPRAFAASPTVVCSDEQVLECTSARGAVGAVAATVQDADGDGLVVNWTINGRAALTRILAAGTTSNALTLALTNAFAVGTNEVRVDVTEDGVNFVTCSSIVIVRDTIPPVIQSIVATPNLLWPPNHKMRLVNVVVRATDACGPVRWRILDIRSNEEVDGLGDGHTSPDWLIARPHTAMLRAERSGSGSGRIYTISVEAGDLAGNTTHGRVQVRVPHDRGNRVWRDPDDVDDAAPANPVNPRGKPGKPPKPARGPARP